MKTISISILRCSNMSGKIKSNARCEQDGSYGDPYFEPAILEVTLPNTCYSLGHVCPTMQPIAAHDRKEVTGS
jgi:hypothetical protein